MAVLGAAGAGAVVLGLAAVQAWQWGLVLRRGEEEPDLSGLLLLTAMALPFALLVIVMRPGSRSLPGSAGSPSARSPSASWPGCASRTP